MPSLKSDSTPSDSQVRELIIHDSSSSVTAKHSSFTADKGDITSEARDAVSPSPDLSMVNHLTHTMEDQPRLTGIVHPKRRKTQKIEDSITQMKVGDDNNKKDAARRKRRKGKDHEDERPIQKKPKVDMKAADLSRPMTHNSVQNEKAAARVEKGDKNTKHQVCKPKRRRKLEAEVEVSISCPASSTKRSKPHRPLPKASSSRSHLTNLDRNVNSDRHTPPSSTQDPQTVALNAQLCGMLIETMALSRASSLPLSSLYKMVMQTQPSLKLQRSEQEWLTVFARVLQEGEAGHGSGVFGKVESSGTVCLVIYIRVLVFLIDRYRMILIDRWRHNGFMFRNKIRTKNGQH